MRIGIIGGSGRVGSALYNEATARGYTVVALVKNVDKGRNVLGLNADIEEFDVDNLPSDLSVKFDVIINAFIDRSNIEKSYKVAKNLSRIFENKNARWIQLLGASSLELPNGELLLSDLQEKYGNPAWIEEPKIAVEILNYLRTLSGVNWTGVSPQENLILGERSKYMVSGENKLIYSHDGNSHVRVVNYASGIIDEIKNEEFLKTRFTVADV